MPWENQSNDPNKRKKNPWGTNGGHHGRGPGGDQGPEIPDLDEVIRKAQDGLKDLFPQGFGAGKAIGFGALVIVALWLASGFYTVQPSEHVVIQKFGKHARTETREGLRYHLPWPIEVRTKVNVTQARETTIGFVKIPGQQNINRDVPAESLMLTSDANIVDLDMQVQWDISSAEHYLFNIDDPVGNIKQVAESAIREAVGQNRMFSIISNERAAVAERAKEVMIRTLDEYNSGINIRQVLIQAAELHPDVQDAFQDVQSAKQDAEGRQNKAQAYSKEIIPEARGQAKKMVQEAEGYKESVIAQAKGDADRFSAILKSYRTGKEVTRERIFLETMEEVLSKTQKTIVDQTGGTGVVPYLPLNELNKNNR